jgi:hypothetical protein
VAEFASGFNIMVFIVINLCVLVLRTSAKSHWYDPGWKSPLFPFTQILGIIGGSVLIYAMGMKAVIGGSAAVIIGVVIYQSYGKRHIQLEITPWETFRLMLSKPDEVEHRRRLAAFHAADIERTNHLNLNEFTAAMIALGYFNENDQQKISILREYFHKADKDDNGIIDIDEFLIYVEQTNF